MAQMASPETTVYLPPLGEPVHRSQFGDRDNSAWDDDVVGLDNLVRLDNVSVRPVGSVTDVDPMQDLIVVAVWSAMLSYALVSNALVILGVLHSDQLRRSTSYWFIISLAACDLFMALISLSHIVPATFFHDRFVRVNGYRNVAAIFAYDVFWYTGVIKLGVMALNRLASIAYPMEYKQIFNPNRTLFIIGCTYCCGLTVSLPTLFPCCHTLYDHTMWVTTYSPIDTWYSFVDLAVNVITVVVMVFSYSIIIWKVHSNQRALAKYKSAKKQAGEQHQQQADNQSCVTNSPEQATDSRHATLQPSASVNLSQQQQQRQQPHRCTVTSDDVSSASCYSTVPPQLQQANDSRRRKDTQKKDSRVTARIGINVPKPKMMSKREFRLFTQFFAVSLVFLMTWSTWLWLPRVTLASPLATKWLYFAMTSLYFVNNSINPTLYLIFNIALRKEVLLVSRAAVPRPVAQAVGMHVVRRATTVWRNRPWTSERETGPTAGTGLLPAAASGSRCGSQSSAHATNVQRCSATTGATPTGVGASALAGAGAGHLVMVTVAGCDGSTQAHLDPTGAGAEPTQRQRSTAVAQQQRRDDNQTARAQAKGERTALLMLKKAASDANDKRKIATIVITSAEGSSFIDEDDDSSAFS